MASDPSPQQVDRPDPDHHARWEPGPLDRLGDRVWVVLGGGGLKGLGHVGAFQALEEAGVEVAGIVGCSIGALVGACVAGGLDWEELVPLAFDLERRHIARFNRRAVWVNGIRQESLFQEEPLREYIERVVPVKEWDDVEVPLQVNAVNLGSGAMEWFGTGADTGVPLVDAVYASAALPVFYPPARVGERFLVDGGVGESFPIGRAAELGATGVVGIDVGSGQEEQAGVVVEQGMLAIHQRAFSIMARRRRIETRMSWDGPPLLYIRPRLEGYQTFDFDEIQYFIEEGYRAARAALMEGL